MNQKENEIITRLFRFFDDPDEKTYYRINYAYVDDHVLFDTGSDLNLMVRYPTLYEDLEELFNMGYSRESIKHLLDRAAEVNFEDDPLNSARRKLSKSSKSRLANQVKEEKFDDICTQINKQHVDFKTLLSPEQVYWDKCNTESSCYNYINCINSHIPSYMPFQQLFTSPFVDLPVTILLMDEYTIYIFHDQKGKIDQNYLFDFEDLISKRKNGLNFVDWFFSEASDWNERNIVLFITKKQDVRIIGYIKGTYDSKTSYVIDRVAVDEQFSKKGICKIMINTLCNFLYYSKLITQVKIWPVNYPAYKCYMKTIGQYFPFFITIRYDDYDISKETKSLLQLALKDERELVNYVDDFSFYSITHKSNI